MLCDSAGYYDKNHHSQLKYIHPILIFKLDSDHKLRIRSHKS